LIPPKNWLSPQFADEKRSFLQSCESQVVRAPTRQFINFVSSLNVANMAEIWKNKQGLLARCFVLLDMAVVTEQACLIECHNPGKS
jgi:hypothetical protein